MNYNSRCTVFFSKKVPGYLGEDEVETETKIIPCGKSFLSDSEQMNFFGKYNKAAFKLHLQGRLKGVAEIEFEGLKRNIFDLKYHRNSTVVIVS